MGSLFKRNGYWYIYFRVGGKRVRKKAGTNKRAAEEWLREQEARAWRHERGLPCDNRFPVEKLKARYLKHIEATVKTNTLGGYKQDIEWVLSALGVEFVCDITPELIDTYRAQRVRQVSERTVNLEVQAVKRMLSLGVQWGLIDSSPIANVKPLRQRRKKFRRALTPKEAELLLQHSTPRFRPIWLCFLHTGLRKSELIELRWSDIDWNERLILVQAKERWEPKTGETRVIPITDELYAELKRLKCEADRAKRRSPYVFTTKLGTPYRWNLLKRFLATVRRAGIDPDGVDLHALRYTFITDLIRNGANIKAVQELAGHKNIKVTLDIYSQVFACDRIAAMKKLSYGKVSQRDETVPYVSPEKRVVSHVVAG